MTRSCRRWSPIRITTGIPIPIPLALLDHFDVIAPSGGGSTTAHDDFFIDDGFTLGGSASESAWVEGEEGQVEDEDDAGDGAEDDAGDGTWGWA